MEGKPVFMQKKISAIKMKFALRANAFKLSVTFYRRVVAEGEGGMEGLFLKKNSTANSAKVAKPE